MKKHVLILNSYHPGYVWSDNVMKGISSILEEEPEKTDVHIEYMDTKRNTDSEHLENLFRLYRHKFKNVKFDVIISSDDYAFRFLLEHRNELFPGVPYIFCGVNKFSDSMLKGQEKIAGIVETVDFAENFNLMMKLQPGLKHIFVVGSNSYTGAALTNEIKEIVPLFKGHPSFTVFDDYDISELKEKLKTLGSDTAVFSLCLIVDKAGKLYSYNKSVELVVKNSDVPVYSSWEFTLGKGVIGGEMVSSYDHGREAGEMALKVLKGKMNWTVPEIKKSRTQYIFDYEQMKRFRISRSDLPEGGIILNEPSPFYRVQRSTLALIAFFIIFLGAVIFVLAVNIQERKRVARDLLEQKERRASIIEGANVGTWEWNVQTGETIFNERWAEIIGYKLEELSPVSIGTWTKYTHPDDLKSSDEMLRKHFNGELGYYDCECRMKHKDGHWVWVLDRGKVISWTDDGKPLWMFGTHIDITKRKQREEEIRKFKAISDNASFGVTILDRERNTIYVNEAYAWIHGYKVNELIGKHHSMFHDEEAERVAKDAMQKLAEEGFIEPFEEMHRRKDGSFFPAYIYASLIKDEKGEPLYIASFLTDITERKKAERIIKESEEKYRTQVEEAMDAIFIADAKTGILVDCNREAEKLVGRKKSEIIGKHQRILHPPEEIEGELSKSFKKHLQDKEGHAIETKVITKKGEIRDVSIKANLMEINGRKFLNGIFHDITEHKKAEKELKASLEEKEVLLKEVHHRVKNNMQVISSMLMLQSSFVKDKGFANILQLCQDRIMSMALVHEKIYQSKDLANINFREYLETLTKSLFSSYAQDEEKIAMKLDIEDM